MIEVEVKVRIENRFKTEEQLDAGGFRKGNLTKESDLYFDDLEGGFRAGDKALRLRHSENLTKKESVCLVTYKGPKMDLVSMTRKELETEVGDPAVFKAILKELGYKPVYPVKKLRQYYHKESMSACLDKVEGLGDFLELEVIVENDMEKEKALDRIFGLLKELGYEKEDGIRTSYLSMLMGKKE